MRTSYRARNPWPAAIGLVLLALALGCREARERPNLLVIMVDTLRADHLGCYGYPRATSPHIDRLAERGTRFETAVSVSSYTRPAVGSLFTGLYPSAHGAVAYGESVAETAPAIAELLAGAGYQTIGFSRSPIILPEFGFARGFERYDYVNLRRPGQPLSAEALAAAERGEEWFKGRDERITREVLPLIEGDLREPFYLYLHFVGPHAPYRPDPEATSFLSGPLTPAAALMYENPEVDANGVKQSAAIAQMTRGVIELDDESRSQLVDLYDGEIAATDGEIGTILDALERHGLTERTVVVVLADHGEEFWDHGGMGHGHTHYRELLDIPLVIAGPGIAAATVSTPVSLVDVPATLLELAGVEVPPAMDGASLADHLRPSAAGAGPRPLFSEGLARFDSAGEPVGFYRSLQWQGRKLVLDGRRRLKQLFDLEADPGEHDNLLPGDTRAAEELMRALVRIHRDNIASEFVEAAAPGEVSAELAAELAALGYLGSGVEADAPPVLRRPYVRLDLDPYGLLGDETELDRYAPVIDFAKPDTIVGEQKLYGWVIDETGGWAVMRRRAGVRLERGPDHTVWRLRGRAPRLRGQPLGVELAVRVDGGEPGSYPIPRPGPFEIGGPLPKGDGDSLRLDFDCVKSPLLSRFGSADEGAGCVFVESVALETEP